VRYANERKQFNCLISSFGAIKYKLAEQVIRTFVTESAVYRASKDIDEAIKYYVGKGEDKGRDTMEAFNQFAIESAAMKVFASEMLDYVVDEAVQIHGGMGYSSEMPVDRAYRDSRINRIFEGTNEINRILVADTVLKRAAKKEIPVMEEAQKALDEIPGLQAMDMKGLDYFAEKQWYIRNFKKAALILLKTVSEKFTKTLVLEQEILNNISDIIMLLYAAESAMLRIQKLGKIKSEEAYGIYRDMLDVFTFDAASAIRKFGLDTVYSFAFGDTRELLIKGIEYYTRMEGVNVRDARRRIADLLISENRYCY
jgi:hypothetical protein